MTRLHRLAAGSAALLAALAPRPAEATCVPAELAELLEEPVEICPEEPVCPCFSADDIDAAFAGMDPYLYAWGRRPWRVSQQTSLRADAWACTGAGWQAPTVGFDTYIETDACGATEAYVCETWDDTWLAAPYHRWAGGGASLSVEITAEEFDACEAVLLDWAEEAGAPSWSW